PYLQLEVRRAHALRDAAAQLAAAPATALRKQLRVLLVGEDGVDDGGVQREFFGIVADQLFHKDHGMFELIPESRLCWFNREAPMDEETLEEYALVGRLLGLALYNGATLDVPFPLVLFKKLLGRPVDPLNDLKELDPLLHAGLCRIAGRRSRRRGPSVTLEDGTCISDGNCDIDEAGDGHDEGDDVDDDDDDETVAALLDGLSFRTAGLPSPPSPQQPSPDPDDQPVTRATRAAYANVYAGNVLGAAVEPAFAALRRGFDAVVAPVPASSSSPSDAAASAVSLFSPEELRDLVVGCTALDFRELEKNAVYDGWDAENSTVRAFWAVAHTLDEPAKRRLLRFVTGSDRAPVGGLARLPFVLARAGPDSDRLPSSHTCYNVLLLSDYGTRERLEEKLRVALDNASCGFYLV
ncbi:Ubiquitin-protein ligase E3A, partial [Cladochytrium tenue]